MYGKENQCLIAKQILQLDGSMQSEQRKRSQPERKTEWFSEGQVEKLKIDVKRKQIDKYLMMGLGIRRTAKLIDEATRVNP